MKKQNIYNSIKRVIQKDLDRLKFLGGKISTAKNAKSLSYEQFIKNEKAQAAYNRFEQSRAAAAAEIGTKAARSPIQKAIEQRAKDGVFLDKDTSTLFDKIGIKADKYQKIEVADITSGVHFFVNEEIRGIIEGMEENGEAPQGYTVTQDGQTENFDYIGFIDRINSLKGSDKTLDITLERDSITGAQVMTATVRNTPPTGKGTGRKSRKK